MNQMWNVPLNNSKDISRHKLLLAAIISQLFFCISSKSQNYNFQSYRESEGLNNRFIYSINQDKDGFLLIGTGDGLYKFDGFTFQTFSVSDSLADNFITCSYTDNSGKIWYGHNNGNVTIYENGTLHIIDLSSFHSSRISDIVGDKTGNIWIATQTSGLMKIGQDLVIKNYRFGLENVYLYSILFDANQQLWLGTDSGVIRCEINKKNEILSHSIPELEGFKIQSITNTKNGDVLVATDDSGIYSIEKSLKDYSVTGISTPQLDLSSIRINKIAVGNDESLWISTSDYGLLNLGQRRGSVYTTTNQYKENRGSQWSVSSCFIDREKNIWIGTQGDGLFRLLDDYFTMYSICDKQNQCDVYSFSNRGDTIWSASGKEIYSTSGDSQQMILVKDFKEKLGDANITSIHAATNGILWIGTSGSGLFQYATKTKQLKPFQISEDALTKNINQLSGYEDELLIGTDYGMYQLKNEKVVSHVSITSGLAHNVVGCIYRDSKNRIWLGTPNEVTYIEDGIIKHVRASESNSFNEITCFTEDNSGRVWAGTGGSGVVMVESDSLRYITKDNGLFSGYCNSIVCDENNTMWIGHRGGVTRYNVTNGKIQVYHPGSGAELLFHRNAVYKSSNGLIFLGTNEGILQYNPLLDVVNKEEPIIQITGINISDSLYSMTDQISLPFGKHQIHLDFVGISLRKTNQVRYQYYLEGFDKDWCDPTSQNFVRYNQLAPGSYIFKIKAFNGDGFGGTSIKEIKITIDHPFWQKWWFIAAALSCSFLLVRYIVVKRERFLRENQAYLQTELAARTMEVVHQKEQLENKNKDITDSILYAKNIQKAMLPAPDSLNKMFRDSFVFYKPRDIVSGDFYWVEKFGNKIIVACADCTGHGVPGAFMSLIGSTLLKEVSRIPWVQSPDDILSQLDLELRHMLKRENSQFGVEDGIDISVVEFDEETKELRTASANRPVIVYSDGTRKELKGDRQQVGGGNSDEEKRFSVHNLKLHQGDVVYMFSDGITDQFGGQSGRKMKKSGLFNILDQIFHYDMNEQRKIIRENFFEWKGDLPQIDDVILLGIRV